jgi:hypothetical protein
MTTAIDVMAPTPERAEGFSHFRHFCQGVNSRGLDFVVDGDRLRWRPRVDDALRTEIVQHKPVLVQWLKRGDTVQKMRTTWAPSDLWIVPLAEPGGISEHDAVEELAATGIPRGSVWTETELETLLAVGVRGEALRAVASARLAFDGDVVGVHPLADDHAPSGPQRPVEGVQAETQHDLDGGIHDAGPVNAGKRVEASRTATIGPAPEPRDNEILL